MEKSLQQLRLGFMRQLAILPLSKPISHVYGIMLLWLCCQPSSALAFVNVTIVYPAQTPAYQVFVESFKQEIERVKPVPLRVKEVDLQRDSLTAHEGSDLVIALGEEALAAASQLKYTIPVLGVFSSKTTLNKLFQLSNTRTADNFTIILTDQPFHRQAALVKALLPKTQKVGLLLGPASTWNSETYRTELGSISLATEEARVNNVSELIPKLNDLLKSCDVLLAVPDNLAYSRETAQPILLTAFRHQKPVVAFSQSYVKSGALAAVYSTASDFAKQAAEIALATRKVPSTMPPPQSPKYFSVAINQQVAKTLGLTLDTEIEIRRKILVQEALRHE